ncbi:putative heat shock factor protein [Podospora fimiseda]|uniref:Heat shock factor protein n=1 Tax=Podospora fimiseda TaxID=252190 RepID=A0AAN7H3C0_9PEZI|nr:putative heat shock factor protein [Podospora fimiseda]
MSSPNNPRKRPAPGAPPMVPVPVQQNFSFGWTGTMDGNNIVDAAATPVNQYAYSATIPTPSNALARRQNIRALVPTGGRLPLEQVSDTWDANFLQSPSTTSVDEHDNIERLEEAAQRAKREAQAKRKQIPPFVQKLSRILTPSSFLDEDRNTDLIRWSDKGDSFIVLDEDEFAKTLIPELFKHNNYASFVRQLNMYGFHKRVGLSDNSMKASERKNKSPSEYYNPYFRRGHPNLLWLINKPKANNSKKKIKKEDGEAESDEDNIVEEAYSGPNLVAAQAGRGAVNGEIAPLQKKDLMQVKTQLERLQQQQAAISNVLNKMRQDHSQLFQQAVMFQNMHERHENSINAILTFLANVFRKSLEEGQSGIQNIQDLLASVLPPQGHGPTPIPTVDLRGFVNRPQNTTATATPKRAQRLLPPVPVHATGKASTLSPTTHPAAAPHSGYQRPQMGTVTELFDNSPGDTTSPAYLKNELQSNPQGGMMKIIQDSNAANVNTTGIDLPNVAATTPVTMSSDQRNKMISLMAGSSNPNSAASTPAISVATTAAAVNGIIPPPVTTAASSAPPVVPSSLPMQTTVPLSLSPILSAPPIPPPLAELEASSFQLEQLQQLQNQQAMEIDTINSMLGPFSPSGRIPGLDTNGQPNYHGYFPEPDDMEQFINHSAYDPTTGGGAGGHDLPDFTDYTGDNGVNDFNNFTLDGTGGMSDFDANTLFGGNTSGNGTGRISAANTPSPAGTEEISRSDFVNGGDSPERENKRRRREY